MVSDHVGTACGTSDFRLYIEDCDFDSVFAIINFVNGGDLNPPLEPGSATGRLLEYDQACICIITQYTLEYFSDPAFYV